MDISSPQLIEPGVYTFLKYSLKQCHLFKWKYYNYIVNISLGIGFFIFVGIFCYFHYKGAPTPEERQLQSNKAHQYIADKIKNYRIAKQREHQELITSLPSF